MIRITTVILTLLQGCW